jgi:aryl-alcohol dehydrogenase-like predicted oxidoreductase
MRYRRLGRTCLEVSEIGFGAWGVGGDWWAGADDAESLQSMRHAFEMGVNFVDTAHNYGNGHSEEVVGQAVRAWPGKVYVATKVPPKNYTWPPAPGSTAREVFPKEWLIECTETSLKRLGVERIDLQQLHVWADPWADEDEWKEAILQLKQQGKVANFGISLNYPLEPDFGAAAIRTGLIDVAQVVFNIYEQAPLNELFPLALQENAGVIVRCPLDEGALTGKITPESTFAPGSFQDWYFRDERKREVYEHAQALGFLVHDDVASLPEAALRYCLSFAAVSSVIVGMRKPAHTRLNVAASDKGPLPEADLARLAEYAWPHNYWA